MKIMIVGASGGIGRLLTKHYDTKENKLYLTYNTSKENILSVANAKFTILKCDFTKKQEVERIYSNINSLDIIFNALGVVANNLIYRMEEEEWDRVIDTNLKSVFLSCRYGYEKLVEKGHIINFSSVLSRMGMIGATNYVASKGGIEAFTRSFALECLHEKKIFVNGVALGYFKVGMGLILSEKITKLMKEKIPIKEFGEPTEILKVVDYIISSEYLVGQIINLNGGLVL